MLTLDCRIFTSGEALIRDRVPAFKHLTIPDPDTSADFANQVIRGLVVVGILILYEFALKKSIN